MKNYRNIIDRLAYRIAKKQEAVMEKARVFDTHENRLHKLKDKLTEEYKLWNLKKSKYPNRFHDVERDVNSIKPLLNKQDLTAIEKSTIDRLCEKYSVK